MKEETRPPDTTIPASDAVEGFWYTVGSGEIERCAGARNRGRGVQVGFVGIGETGADPEDIRWIQGKAPVLVADEVKAADLMRAMAQRTVGKPPDMAFEICPRNGLTCSICGSPQRETPGGAACENGHGEALGVTLAAYASQLAAERSGITQTVGMEQPDSAKTEIIPLTSIALSDSEREKRLQDSETERLRLSPPSAREDLEDVQTEAQPEIDAPASPRVTPVYHKSLHTDWRTPKALFDAQVRRWGSFWLDAAATEENKLCEYHLSPETDALSVDWEASPEIVAQFGRNVWLNFPYSKGEDPCTDPCDKKKCAERGYHVDQRVHSSGEWLSYARNQALKGNGPIITLGPARIETQWWKEAVRHQPPEAGVFITGRCDPFGGPAAEFMNDTPYPAATWFEFRWTNLVVDIVEIEDRVDFDRGGNDGGAGFPSVVVTFYGPGQI